MQNYLDMWERTPHTFGDQKYSTCGHGVKVKETQKREIQKDGEICNLKKKKTQYPFSILSPLLFMDHDKSQCPYILFRIRKAEIVWIPEQL